MPRLRVRKRHDRRVVRRGERGFMGRLQPEAALHRQGGMVTTGASLRTRRVPAVKPGFPRAIPVCLMQMLCTRERGRPGDQCPPCAAAARAQPAGRGSSAGRTPGRARPSRRKRRLPGSGGAGPGPRLWREGPAQPGQAGSASPRPPSVSPLGAAAQTPARPGAARRGSGAAQAGDGGEPGEGPGQGPARGGRLRGPGTPGLGCWQ